MLDHTVGVFAWGVAVSLLVIGLAFLSDGRGAYALNVLKRAKARKEGIDYFATLARDEGDWQLVGKLSEIDRAEADRAGLLLLTDTRR